jgi:Bifunctional PLP-dependent enzyme with beta-cystathionase and maltose regulon repressor activities
MDLKAADVVQEAVEATVRQRDYGYPRRHAIPAERIAAEAWVGWAARRHGWEVDPADVVVATDVMQACVAALLSFSEEGDGILLPTPCYPPFRSCIMDSRRRLIDCPMSETPEGFRFDCEAMEAAIDDSTRMILLCNPHNPTGRVMTVEELSAVADLAEKHDLIVFVDEIHADIVYPGFRHIPLATLSPEAAARTVTATSATKSFTTPALRLALMHFGAPALRDRFEKTIPKALMGKPAITAIDASTAAWTDGDEWFDTTMSYLGTARKTVAEAVATMPGLSLHLPESTYLAFIDCRGLGLDRPAAAHFLDTARVGFSEGEGFAKGYEGWIRLNFSTAPDILGEMLTRLRAACLETAGG